MNSQSNMSSISKRLCSVAATAAVIVWSVGCGAKSPTSPTTAATPTIASVAPSSTTVSSGTQILTVKGSGFSAVSVVLRAPDGGTTEYPPTTISELTATSFKASVTLAVAGAWSLSVRNSDGRMSAAVPLDVTQPTPTNPQILTVTPEPIVSNANAQTIVVAGVNFRAGLSLIVRNSVGTATTYNGASLSTVTATSFTAVVALSSPGFYELTVRNADGLESGAYVLTVNATPLVTDLTPATLTASSAPQSFEVFGMHFLTGVYYVLKGPDTGAVAHGSVDVTELTSIHFKGVGVFSVPGAWTITVINANGVSSAEFAFIVR